MMGFYPVVPGLPMYVVGTPSFEEVSVTLPNGKTFTVTAPRIEPDNKYIQRVVLNGKELSRLWFTHAELMAGGTLTLEMGPRPNKTLGTSPSDFPPSSMEMRPESVYFFGK